MSAGNSAAHRQQEVRIHTPDAQLDGSLAIPVDARGLVVFAHGSGSSRFSSRNQRVAQQLNRAGLGTLLFDLLTAEESVIDDRTAAFRFDIPLLARRLVGTVDWLASVDALKALRVGVFGASTGAAAALIAASECPRRIGAVVSRGGRPDLAGPALESVQAPTLLIVGSLDVEVIALNAQAAGHLRCAHTLRIVEGATHLFEEPGKLDEVAVLAADWFSKYLTPTAAGA